MEKESKSVPGMRDPAPVTMATWPVKSKVLVGDMMVAPGLLDVC